MFDPSNIGLQKGILFECFRAYILYLCQIYGITNVPNVVAKKNKCTNSLILKYIFFHDLIQIICLKKHVSFIIVNGHNCIFVYR